MESTLALKLSQLESAVGDFLGYGLGEEGGDTAWVSKQQSDITRAINSGLSTFYFPSAIEGMVEAGYSWSFLKPFAELTLLEDADSLLLPDDFGGIEGRLVIEADDARPCPVFVTNESHVRQMHAADPENTGQPQFAAVRQGKTTGIKIGTRSSLYFFPTADADYTVRLSYYFLPNALTAANPYPVGGAQHAETIQAACIAAAELYRDDQRGPRWMYFQERLAASIGYDRKLKPAYLGYNGDASESRLYGRMQPFQTITIGGVTPT